ncbi:MAG: DNA/RNA nuclease SfsA [Eubacteriales bacterium]|nr:DNA/RNA nuclease SfsA [Eubacteriales bacterium]
MIYENILPAVFVDRPNRFIAHVELNGRLEVCHVKNTGRCRELLIPGCRVYVQHQPSPTRKTAYDLIAVEKGERLLNMDANAPNRVFNEYVRAGRFLRGWSVIRPETTHGDSRFDFYLESPGHRLFAEVKGVTLEDDGVMRFPDAPTERGVKHLEGLARCVQEGYEAWAVFVIQTEDVRWMEPNRRTHPAFADALRQAAQAGVHLLALDCHTEPDRLEICRPVEIRLR